MNRYVILCDCGGTVVSPTWFQPVAGVAPVIAVVDGRYVTPNYFRGNPPGGFVGYSLKRNRFGESRDPLSLRCPGGCSTKMPRIRMNTIVAAVRLVDQWATEKGHALPEVDVLDGETPASPTDAELQRRQVEADLFGEDYDGPQPQMVPHHTRRKVIRFRDFAKAVSQLPKHRRREPR